MDRDTIIAIAITTVVLTLIGGFYLSPSKRVVADPAGVELTADATPAEPRFSPEDVRHKFEQKAAKEGRRRPAEPVSDVSSPEPESSENEAPPNDESAGDESAEEPPIE